MVQSGPDMGSSRSPFAVLWDMDGVLVDTSQYHYAAWRRLLAEFGKQLSESEFRATFGLRDAEILPRWLPDLSEEQVEELSERKESYFREMLPEQIPMLPGAERLVAELAGRGIAQAAASSTPRANLETILSKLHLPITVCVAAEDVAAGKPAPDVFLKAAERLGMPAHRCVVVEDAVAGVEGAHRAGMGCLAVATTWPRERLQGADRVVDSLEEISMDDLARLALTGHRSVAG